MAIDKLAQVHNCKVSRSAVGDKYCKQMNDITEFGGEGNGGVILRESLGKKRWLPRRLF